MTRDIDPDGPWTRMDIVLTVVLVMLAGVCIYMAFTHPASWASPSSAMPAIR